MSAPEYVRLASLAGVAAFRARLEQLGLDIPCDEEVLREDSPLLAPAQVGGRTIGNRLTVHPMEGWDATPEGRPTQATFERWRKFGAAGAKLIWGGEAAAVRPDGRAHGRQLLLSKEHRADFVRLRETLITEHERRTGKANDLLVGLQLTHSGRYARPDDHPRPLITHRHPILDRRMGLGPDYPLASDATLRTVIADIVEAAIIARDAGFDFVDVKHCHGYLAHELLAAHTREGEFGGSFQNRTRFLREAVTGIRRAAPELLIGVRLSAFDTVPYCPDPARSQPGRPGPGIPEPYTGLIPYLWGFGVDPQAPTRHDLEEPRLFLELLRTLGVSLVNLTAGSPYSNPHVQRPALFPPSDGYLPPEDPLVGVARLLGVARDLRHAVPGLFVVGTGYSYLQEFLPHVAQAVVRGGWADSVGLGRTVLTYPEIIWDALHGKPADRRRICRTFSDCTTAPRLGLPSGCYPLDQAYRKSPHGDRLRQLKAERTARTAASS